MAIMLEASTVDQFAGMLRGRVVIPEDHDYDEARKLWNGMIDRRPTMIVQCSGTADVIASVNFARQHGMGITVKGGGHSVAGRSVADDALMIDLSRMKAVIVDPELKTAQVQAGATLGDMDHETQAFDLATTGGVHSGTGVAGLTLGGGMGYVARSFGLAADNLTAADIVMADGALIRVSETEHPDLLWALRGGGGNIGVVTNFEFKLHELGPEVLTAQIFHPFDRAQDVLQFYRDFVANAPAEVGCYTLIVHVPPVEPFPAEFHGKPAVALVGCYTGEIDEGYRVLNPLQQFGEPILNVVTPMRYTALQSAFDAGFPAGARYYWKSCYLNDLSDDAIDTAISYAESLPGPLTAIAFEPMGGAISRVDATATAYPHRDAAFNFGIFGGWLDTSQDDEVISWARAFHDAMSDYSTGGIYVNYLDGDSEDRAKAAYGVNYQRLQEIRARYDPNNLFTGQQQLKA